MAKNDDQPRPEPFCGELDAANRPKSGGPVPPDMASSVHSVWVMIHCPSVLTERRVWRPFTSLKYCLGIRDVKSAPLLHFVLGIWLGGSVILGAVVS